MSILKTSRLRLIFIVTAVVVVAAIAAVVYVYLIVLPTPSVPSETTDNKEQLALLDSASSAIEKGDIAETKRIYQEQIDTETDVRHKIMLTINLSSILYAEGDHKQALVLAKEAEQMGDDKFLATDWLAQVYEFEKEYEMSAEYYERAGTLADSPMNQMSNLDGAYYKNEAARVRALIGAER